MRARGQMLRAIVLSLSVSALIAISLPAAMTAAPGDGSADSLRNRREQLQERSHDALLELYSIETKLERARARVSELDRQKAQIERERKALQGELRIARKVIKVTQRNLGDYVRALYEAGDVDDPIAIIFGAESIDDAVTRLEGLDQIINQQKSLLHRATNARKKLLRLRANLDRRSASLDRLREQASASAAGLASALSSKSEAIERLSNERDLTNRQLTNLSKQATKAASTSLQAESEGGGQAAGAPPPPSATTDDSDSGAGSGSGSGERQLTVSATCYCLKGTTASGLPVGPGIVATDPSVIPLGTRMSIPGYGEGVAADTGSAVKGLTIDLWVASCAQASAYGRRTLTITIH